ncbi:MAG: Gfo/Idh/MocA family protein [Planctomycetota bacterium]|jgi:predicted dehydrogenase
MDNNIKVNHKQVTRRKFIKASAAVSVAALTASHRSVYAAGSDKIRIALIGCGNRGTAGARECMASSKGVEIVALADVFPDKIEPALDRIKKQFPDDTKVSKDDCYVGFDAYKKVCARDDVDLVLLETPPGFRPVHVKAAIEAGKNVFLEKPGAVDPVGIRTIIAASDLAKKKGLAIVVGTQQRRMPHYQEIVKRIQDGKLGPIIGGEAHWLWNHQDWHAEDRQPGWSDMEWQIRCWPYFTWLSGDHIVEQHLHNMDIINWVMGSPPVKCNGMGGRQSRTEPKYGHIFDHFAVEYEYPGGIRIASYCRQVNKTYGRVGERIACAKGWAWTCRGSGFIKGASPYECKKNKVGGVIEEHRDLIASIRAGKPLNEGRQIAESTMAAIMGRMSAYTGKEVTWDFAMNESKLDLSPPKYELGDLPVAPVAIPGKTKLV